MIVPRQGFKKSYRYGGSGIFDSITKLLMRLFTSGAAKQLASSALDAGTKVASSPSQPQDINSLIAGSTVDIQNLVKKLNTGMGIKTINRLVK